MKIFNPEQKQNKNHDESDLIHFLPNNSSKKITTGTNMNFEC